VAEIRIVRQVIECSKRCKASKIALLLRVSLTPIELISLRTYQHSFTEADGPIIRSFICSYRLMTSSTVVFLTAVLTPSESTMGV
jgi:hypothetical protein